MEGHFFKEDVMKTLSFALMLLSLISLSGCNTEDAAQDTVKDNIGIVEATPETDAKDNEQDINEKVTTVSPLALEEFLQPFDDYSWEMTEKPEYVMLHFTSAVVLSKEEPYDIKTVRGIFEENSLSIHYIIDREGVIHCWLPETRAAWHAGKGTFNNDERLTNAMNKYSIGIEMLAIGSKKDMAQYLTDEEYDNLSPDLIGYTDAQYESLGKLVRDICTRNGIPFDETHVIGHDMYNPAKTDPGELFDWSRLFPQ